jgi:hypothetical protein
MALSFAVALAIIVGTGVLLLRGMKMALTLNRPTIVLVFGLIVAAALAVGIRFGVFGEFQINDRIRIQGAPVPLVVFVLEGQNWTDFVKPRLVGYLCMIANALFPVALLGLLWIALARRLLMKGPAV